MALAKRQGHFYFGLASTAAFDRAASRASRTQAEKGASPMAKRRVHSGVAHVKKSRKRRSRKGGKKAAIKA